MGKVATIEHIRALSDVSIHIPEGMRIGLVGPNGSGKTSLLRIMAGILQPTEGRVFTKGKVVSMIDQSLGMDLNCTGLENILRRGIYLGIGPKQMSSRVDEIVDFSELGHRIQHPLYTYSAGMRTRLSFSISTAINPEILIVDEGLGMADERFQTKASKRLDDLIKQASIFVIASHSAAMLDRFGVEKVHLEGGKIVRHV